MAIEEGEEGGMISDVARNFEGDNGGIIVIIIISPPIISSM